MTCHQPHAGENGALLVEAKVNDLCSQCHDAKKTHMHPIGEPYKDPRTGGPLTCIGCHNPHSSDNEQLLRGSKDRELCILCHKT